MMCGTRFLMRSGAAIQGKFIRIQSLLFFLLVFGGSFSFSGVAFGDESQKVENFSGDFLTRRKLTGDWGGVRNDMANHGVTLDFDATQVTQHIASGGFEGPLFNSLYSDAHETESDAMFNMLLKLDTGKAGLWPGGFLTVRGESRVGQSVGLRAGGLMTPNGDALSPNVPGHVNQDVLAMTELNYAQFLSEKIGLAVGLFNFAEGDSNELAGSLRSRSHFMNAGMRYSPVYVSTVPLTTLGALAIFLPTKKIKGTAGFINSEESAGYNPFEKDAGTTFLTEWKFDYQIAGLPGAQTAGFVYGFNRNRVDLNADPRIQIVAVASDRTAIQTNADTWALYYNGHQYIQGDKHGGWGVFLRAGVSDGHPSPIKWSTAFGVGGMGVGSWRPNDNWGIGGYALGASNEALLRELGIHDEAGFEAFYNIAVAPWLHITGDIQYVSSAYSGINRAIPALSVPGPGDSLVLGLRTNWNF